jgi:hypothetical protein
MAEWGVWVTVIAAIITVVGGGIFAILNRKGSERARTVPSWVELDNSNRELRSEMTNLRDEMEELRQSFLTLKQEQVARDVAITNVLHDISQQWPRDSSAPTFRVRDLEVLGDTIPRPWRLAT